MSVNAIRTSGRGLLLAYDGTDLILGPMTFSIADAEFSPQRVSARCDEFYCYADLVPALENDARSIAEKVRKSLLHLLPRLAGDGKGLGINDHPLHDFKDHITNCNPGAWYGWQFVAAMKTVGEIKAKVANHQAGYSPEQLAGKFEISDETLRRYAKASRVRRPNRGKGKTFRYTGDEAKAIAVGIINSRANEATKARCSRLLDTL